MNKKLYNLFLFLVITSSSFFFMGGTPNVPPYKNPALPIEDRVEDLLKKMTLEEKIDLLGGTGFATKKIDRLGIPELRMTDGPLGVRWEKSTAFPSGIALASAWDPELTHKVGAAIGREVKAKDRHVILGPCVNIARIPQGGRNFESYGEDPFLASRMAVEYIKGVQSEGVAATVKHFACNNQELERDFVDTKVDERALNEIYLPAFKAAVQEADVLCLMNAYNKVNGQYCSENDYLLRKKLKDEWGYKWLVMSDWGAVHSSIPVAQGAMDLEMPTGAFLNEKNLMDAIKKGEVKESAIDDKVRRILRVLFKLGLFEKPSLQGDNVPGTKENRQAALEAERAGIVLLQNNDNILPLDFGKIKSIAVIGPNAKIARAGGGGSSQVDPLIKTSPLDVLKEKYGNKIEINYAEGVKLDGEGNPVPAEFLSTGNKQGLKAEYFDNMDLEGEPAFTRIDKQVNFEWGDDPVKNGWLKDKYSVRWTGKLTVPKSGKYLLETSSDDGIRLFVDGRKVIEDWTNHATKSDGIRTELEKGKEYDIKIEFFENGGSAVCKFNWELPDQDPMVMAEQAAKKSDVVLIFAGTSNNYESEGFDRGDLNLPKEQDELINDLAKINKNVVVILSTGSPVIMDKWNGNVKGIIETWFGGQEMGYAIAEVLSGGYNPSGKLPVSFPKKWADCSAYETYNKVSGTTDYTDGIYVGYRHFDKNKIEPFYPFGYGLSYTTFNYSNIKAEKLENTDKISITFDVENTGKAAGAEVAQLYIKDSESSIDRPEKELKGFRKVWLNPGEKKTLEITVDKDAFSFFDPVKKQWVMEPGEFQFLVGSSSRDIKLTKALTL